MAFVFEAERKICQPLEGSGLSPNHYDPAVRPSVQNSCAPFSSSSKRVLFGNKSDIPGPGDYQVDTSMLKPIVQTVANKDSIIVKINAVGTSAFRSNQERFRSSDKPVPGPGSYDTKEGKPKSFNRFRPRRHSNINRQFGRSRRIVSIPERVVNLFGDTPQLDEMELQGKLGPGCYDFEQRKHKPVSSLWSKSKEKRFVLADREVPGPGKYGKEPVRRKESDYHNNPSSAFISQTCRTYFDTCFYKTNLDFKAKIRQKIKFKDPLPGPGQYDTNLSQLAADKHQTFQFFGSTSERFIQSQAAKVGPGSYNPVLAERKSMNKGPQIYGVGSSKSPSFLPRNNDQLPGPGTYDSQKKAQDKKKGKQPEMFGNTVDRFKKKSVYEIELPGPGAYQYKEPSRTTVASAPFKSGTVRDCNQPVTAVQPSNTPENQTQFYEVHNHELASRLRKQQTFLQNLRKIDVERPPFDSSAFRFRHYQGKEPEEKPDKQVKTVQGARRAYSQRQNSEESKRCTFSKSGRFGDQPYRGPCVGTYDPTSVGKRSFNVKFNH